MSSSSTYSTDIVWVGDLLNTQMIARSVIEYLFLCRALSIYAHTETVQGRGGTLDTDSLEITYGAMDSSIFAGITADNGRRIVLRGRCADTRSEAMVLFIEAVLDTSARYRSELLKQMAESVNLRGKLRHAEGSEV